MSAAGKLDFELVNAEDHLAIRLVEDPSKESLVALKDQAESSLGKKPLHVLVNLSEIEYLSPQCLRTLLQLHKVLKAINRQMRLIGASTDVVKTVKREGLDNSLKICASQKIALTEMGLVSPSPLDVDFLNPFLTATIKVLSTQASTEAKPGRVFKKQPGENFDYEISGVIGVVSDVFAGSVVIGFPTETFLKIMGRLTGEDYREISQEIADGAAELTNIIFGQAKVTLNELGYGIKTALPSVVLGKSNAVFAALKGPRVVIPFATDVGPFFVEICFSNG